MWEPAIATGMEPVDRIEHADGEKEHQEQPIGPREEGLPGCSGFKETQVLLVLLVHHLNLPATTVVELDARFDQHWKAQRKDAHEFVTGLVQKL